MAKLRMTYKNLKALRKTKEYQALLVDLVANNIVPKSVAENLLGYNIPANLIGGAASGNEEQGSGTGTEGSGTEGSGGESDTGNTVTLLYFDAGGSKQDPFWDTAEYDLTEDPTGDGILDFAQDAFDDDSIDQQVIVVEASESDYVEGTSELSGKYVPLDPQPETLEHGMLIHVYSSSVGD